MGGKYQLLITDRDVAARQSRDHSRLASGRSPNSWEITSTHEKSNRTKRKIITCYCVLHHALARASQATAGSVSVPTKGKLSCGSVTSCRRPAAPDPAPAAVPATISISAFLMCRSSAATSRHRTRRDTASRQLLRRPSHTVCRRRSSFCRRALRSLHPPHHRTTEASLAMDR
ncbi:unnamed protein product [Urochloa humidicola]